jgi:hypothetical protein
VPRPAADGVGCAPAHGGPSTSSPRTGHRRTPASSWVRVQDLLRVDCQWRGCPSAALPSDGVETSNWPPAATTTWPLTGPQAARADKRSRKGLDHGQAMDLLVVRLDEGRPVRWRWLVNAGVAAPSARDAPRPRCRVQGPVRRGGTITSRGAVNAPHLVGPRPCRRHVLQGRTLDADRMPAPAVSALHSAGRGG